MQKARRRIAAPTACKRTVFTPILWVLPTFPSRYWSTIGLQGVFSLAGWSPRVLTGFLVSRHTQVSQPGIHRYRYGGITLYPRTSQSVPVP